MHVSSVMNNTFVTHPSVRIKGSENNYQPVQCFESICADKTYHLHCPFCVKTESYTDPVILKAHYRVKHVDKGIDFAGLKILRCCDQCAIVGVIKGEKKFKGAHWHCYKCRNGFNRRDEAIKHYKTHFRNPQTTFQIQIAQEVNQPMSQGFETDEAAASIQSEDFCVQSIHPVLTEAITSFASSPPAPVPMPVIHKSLESAVSMPGVGAIETVGMTDTHTIMIIQEDGNLSSLQDTGATQDVITSEVGCGRLEGSLTDGDDVQADIDQINELQQTIEQLHAENAEQQKQIEQLKSKVQEQSEHIAAYKLREQELLDQLSVPLDKNIMDVLEQLESQHRVLLQQQLAQLKRSYIQAATPQPKMYIVNSSLGSQLAQPIELQNLNPDTVSSSASEVITIDFQSAKAEDMVDTIEQTDDMRGNHAVVPKEEEEAAAGFEMLQQDFTDTLEEDRLQIEDESIPIENDGVPEKRQKIK